MARSRSLRRFFAWRRRRILRGRRRRGSNPHIWSQRIELFRADSANRQQIFHSLESSALLPHVNDPLGGHRTNAGQFLKFLCIRSVQINGLGRRTLLGLRHCPKAYQSAKEKGKPNRWMHGSHVSVAPALLSVRRLQPLPQLQLVRGLQNRTGKSARATQIRLPCASYTSGLPNKAACDSIWARSPTTTICACAESKYFCAASRTSAEVSCSTCSRYVSR